MDEEIGKWLLDISKYIITAYILSQMFGKDNDSWWSFIGAVLLAVLLFALGYYLIKKGKSNKSYGVNVAKLAKLPDEVIQRANRVLETLEANNVEDRLVEEKVTIIEKESEVEKYLKTIDPMTLSPLDALSTLIELKKLLK